MRCFRLKIIVLVCLGINLSVSSQNLDVSSPKCFPLFRRVHDLDKINSAAFRAKIEPKLRIIYTAVTQGKLDGIKAIYNNSQESLNALAGKLDQEEIKKWAKNWFQDSEIEHIKNILRNYSSYSSADIESISGFSKTEFPAVLYLWLELADTKIVHLPMMHDDGGAELLKEFILSGKKTADEQGKEFILLLERLSLGANFFIRFLAEKGLSITLEELFTEQQYRETLREAFRAEERVIMGFLEDLSKGTITPAMEKDQFCNKLFPLIIDNKIKIAMEEYDFSKDSDLEAKRLAMLASNIIMKKISDAAWKGDIDGVLFHSREFIDAAMRSMQIRDMNIVRQATAIAGADTHVQIIMGAGHQLTAKADNLVQISREEGLSVYYAPLWEVLRKKIFSLEVVDEEKDILTMFPYIFAGYLMKKYEMFLPQLKYAVDVARISAAVASRWEKQDCLNLAAALRQGEPQAQICFEVWVLLHGTEEEKMIFRF